MNEASISDFGNGLYYFFISAIVLVILVNTLPSRYFRWRVSLKPADLDKFTQLEFDWCWNLTALVILSYGYGLLWAMNAMNIDYQFWLEDLISEYALPAIFMFVCYIALYLHTGRHPSKPAIWAYAGMTLLSILLGYAISIGLLNGVSDKVLEGIYGNKNQVTPDRIETMYALLSWFFAPDFTIYLFLTNFAAMGGGFAISQVIEAITRLIKVAASGRFSSEKRRGTSDLNVDEENVNLED
ncbi:MAG TPA: hypothetical protein VKM55_27195 [Candidatus Lokiarchaeia archaeon]|nr:hypothetical protein [Candidatus Lokiarchaeia archaeon]